MNETCARAESPGLCRPNLRKIPLSEAVGTVLAHDITEIRRGECKGRAFKRGHVICEEDVCRMQRLGKEHLYVLDIGSGEMHEDEAAYALAQALAGKGAELRGPPREGKIELVAGYDGLLSVNKDALLSFNMLGEVICASLHDHTIVSKGQVVAGTRAIPLIVQAAIVQKAVRIGEEAGGIIRVKRMRRPKAGVVVTGDEVYSGMIHDGFVPVVRKKIEAACGEIIGTTYAPDDEHAIEAGLREQLANGADLLITTGGMSVDPDDVTRFAIRNIGATEITYGSAVQPGNMILVAYVEGDPEIPVIGVPACALHARTTAFDLVLPRLLAGERIGRKELAELGHGGLCMKCEVCVYPACPFGK